MLEGGEPDAIQVETPDDHLCVEAEGRDKEERRRVGKDMGWSVSLAI